MSLLAEYKQYLEGTRTQVFTTFGNQNSQSGILTSLHYELFSILLRRYKLSPNIINVDTFLESLNWYITNRHRFVVADITESLNLKCVHCYIQRFKSIILNHFNLLKLTD